MARWWVEQRGVRQAPWLLLLALAAAAAARAQTDAGSAEEKWDDVYRGTITVKTRSVPGSSVKEVLAEGEIKAPLFEVADTLTDITRFKDFMPHLKVAKYVGKPEADGSVYIYEHIAPPVVQGRDQVARSWIDETPRADGTGAFRAHWVMVPNKLPERPGLIRLKVNDGSWHATPAADGKGCWVVHRFLVDPGGWVPAFAADLANRDGVEKTYLAVEQEANKRHAARVAATPSPGPAGK